MNNRNLAIIVLSISAAALAVLNFSSKPAVAEQAIAGRDYAIVTASTSVGGEALYILDNRSQKLAIFSYDPNTKQVRPRLVRSINDAPRAR